MYCMLWDTNIIIKYRSFKKNRIFFERSCIMCVPIRWKIQYIHFLIYVLFPNTLKSCHITSSYLLSDVTTCYKQDMLWNNVNHWHTNRNVDFQVFRVRKNPVISVYLYGFSKTNQTNQNSIFNKVN